MGMGFRDVSSVDLRSKLKSYDASWGQWFNLFTYEYSVRFRATILTIMK